MPNFATFYFEIAVQWSKSRIFEKLPTGTCVKHLANAHAPHPGSLTF